MEWINRLYNRFSIKTIMIAVLFIFTIIPAIFVYSFTNRFTQKAVTKDYLVTYFDTIFKETSYDLSSMMTQINMQALNMTNYQPLYTAFLQSRENRAGYVTSALSDMLKNTELLSATQIITNSGECYSFPPQSEFIVPPFNSDFLGSITNTNSVIYSSALYINGEYYIAVGKKLYNYFNNYDIGYMIFYIKETYFRSIYENVIPTGSTMYILSDNHIISSNESNDLGSVLKIIAEFHTENTASDFSYIRENERFVSKYRASVPSLNTPLEIVCLSPYTDIRKIASDNIRNITVILLIMLFITVVLVFIITNTLLKNIINLKNNIELFKNTNIVPDVHKSSNEIYQLEASFREMSLNILNLLRTNNEINEKKRMAELSALQSQINPHFIYNALDVISWNAKTKGDEEIADMVYTLASFFRISLHKGDTLILVSEELEHVKSYLSIEKKRFPNLFDAEFKISKDILDMKMLKIVLQPLVENSLKHGFEGMERGGKILIKAYADEEYIIFEVIDNGRGISCNPLSENFKAHDSFHGYGVKNVHDRLQLQYGSDCGLFYDTDYSGGTRVIVKLKRL